MFISHFNRYFEKHARITYFVLLIIIIATFVIFVTPGDVFSSNRRTVSDFGTMYGKRLKADKMQKEMTRCMVGLWLQYPYMFGQNFAGRRDMLLQATLNRMRMIHEMRKASIQKVTDEDVRKFYAGYAMLQKDGKFSPELMNNLVNYVENSLGIKSFELDEIVRENIGIERLYAKVTEKITVSDADVAAELASITLKSAVIAKNDAAAQPTETEVAEFFKSRKADVKLPETKNAVIAHFDIQKLVDSGAALPKIAALKPTDKAVQDYFNDRKNSQYKGKTLDESLKTTIRKTLLQDKVRTFARTQANILNKSYANATAANAAKNAAAFEEAAVANGAQIVKAQGIALGNKIAGLAGDQTRLIKEINSVAVGAATKAVADQGAVDVAMVTAAEPTAIPATLTPEIKAVISDALFREKALAFYTEKVKGPYEVYRKAVVAVRDDKTLTDEQRRTRMSQIQPAFDSQLVGEFFIAEKREGSFAKFAFESYLKDVKAPAEDAIKALYDQRKDEYSKKEVKLGRISVEVKGLDDNARKAKLQRLAAARKKLAGNTDFATVAKEFSEGKGSAVDSDWRDIASLSEKTRTAVENLKKGDIAADVEENDSVTLYKVMERRDGRTLQEVKADLTKEIKDKEAKALAQKDAAEFAQKFADAWWSAFGKDPQKVDGVAILAAQKKAFAKAVIEKFDSAAPFYRRDAQPNEVIQALYGAKTEQPVIDVVTAPKACYAGLLTNVVESRLGDPATEERYFHVLKRSYTNAEGLAAAKADGEKELQRLTTALADGKMALDKAAGKLAFADWTAFTANDIAQNNALAEQLRKDKNLDLNNVVAEIKKLGDRAKGTLLPLQEKTMHYGNRGYQGISIREGYAIVYVADVKAADMSKAKAEDVKAIRDRLMNERKQEAMSKFIERATAESKTQLR